MLIHGGNGYPYLPYGLFLPFLDILASSPLCPFFIFSSITFTSHRSYPWTVEKSLLPSCQTSMPNKRDGIDVLTTQILIPISFLTGVLSSSSSSFLCPFFAGILPFVFGDSHKSVSDSTRASLALGCFLIRFFGVEVAEDLAGFAGSPLHASRRSASRSGARNIG